MLLDDTDTTTYVHDLGREVSDIENDEFWLSLSPVGDNLVRIPKAVLADPRPPRNELVLYHEPASLTVPKQQDNVQRAIVEYKERVRAKRRESNLEQVKSQDSCGSRDESHSQDAMDVD